MNKKKLVRKVQTVMTVKDFGSSVIVTYMAVLLASSTVQLAGSGDHGVWCTGGESGLCHPQAAVPDWVIHLHNWVKTWEYFLMEVDIEIGSYLVRLTKNS